MNQNENQALENYRQNIRLEFKRLICEKTIKSFSLVAWKFIGLLLIERAVAKGYRPFQIIK